MIAVDGYARVSANRKKHDDLSQIGSIFYLLHLCASCVYARNLLYFRATKCSRHCWMAPALKIAMFVNIQDCFDSKARDIENPNRTTFFVLRGLARPGSVERRVPSASHLFNVALSWAIRELSH